MKIHKNPFPNLFHPLHLSLVVVLLFNPGSLLAQASLDDLINAWFTPIADTLEDIVFVSFRFPLGANVVEVPIVLVWLICGALFATVYFKFINLRAFRLSIDIIRGKYTDPNKKSEGEVTHFQALTAALSGTVGLGNIAGVAIAISIGGPGATFWMILAGLLGMSTKFLECTLGVKYRQIDKNGKVFGGPFYYLRDGFEQMKMEISGRSQNFGKIGKVMAAFFAIACIGGSFGGGNMFQVNQAFDQLSNIPEVQNTWLASNGWFFGLIMAVLVFTVIVGGVKSIARVTEKIVPLMCGVYVFSALLIIGYFVADIPKALGAIISGAFYNEAIVGGFIGVLIQGFRRAAFSNEAGIGSATIAHAAVKTDHPASEGIVALLEPFIDTVVVCTMTALVIIISGEYQNFTGDTSDAAGIALTSAAFSKVFSWFPYLLTLAVILFAFSTMITWSYYGVQATAYLFGKSKTVALIYKVVFCMAVIVGAAATLSPVIKFADMMVFAMSFPNIFGLIFLAPVAKDELNKFLAKIKSGEIKAYK